MVKQYIKRYFAIQVSSKDIGGKEIIRIVEKELKKLLGIFYSTKIIRIKYIDKLENFIIISFYVEGIDPHLLIPLLSLIKLGNSWMVPVLMSGTLKSLRESLKDRYSKLVKG